MDDSVKAFYRLAYNREDSDCSVRAVAVACCAPYNIAHAALAFAGRQTAGPADADMIRHAVRSLGCELHRVHTEARTLRALARAVEGEPGAFIALTGNHCAGIFNGEMIDWARDRLFRVRYLFKVEHAKQRGTAL